MSLQNKTAIVTGSAGGLGQVIAEMYLSKGANVVVADINPTRLAAAEAKYAASHPSTALVTEVNVTDEESVKALVGRAVEKFGSVDILVNNAGIMDRFDPAGTCDKALWDKVIAVNMTGPFLMTKHAVQVMEAQGSGLIVNIGSNASFKGFAAGIAYTASKHGVAAITKNTATYYGPKGINTIALMLGGMDTNISEALAAGFNHEGMGVFQASNPGFDPSKTVVPTEHVARYIGFLSEDGMAESANGSCININKNWPAA